VVKVSAGLVKSAITPEQFEMLLPLACEWAATQERRILATGETLSDTMLADARVVGDANHAASTRRHPRDAVHLLANLNDHTEKREGPFVHRSCSP